MRKLKLLIAAFAAFACLVFAGLGQAQDLRAGRDYDALATPQPTEPAGKVEVIEFFSYMCPHCAHFEPVLSKWMKTQPKDVVLRRVPVIFRPQWEAPARLFFTLETLGELERLHVAAFSAIHEGHVDLTTEAAVADWAAKNGIDRKKFTDVYGSFTLQSKAQRAKQMQGAYGIPGVPTLVIAGKYRTPDNFPGSQEDLLKIVDALIVKVRSEQKR
jgi:thiol:disulfide interchange protein DsbA